jgi:hypothetical protein
MINSTQWLKHKGSHLKLRLFNFMCILNKAANIYALMPHSNLSFGNLNIVGECVNSNYNFFHLWPVYLELERNTGI